MHPNFRTILWTVTMAYFGYLWATRGAPSFNASAILGIVMGAVIGFLLALMFARRAKRKKV